MKIRLSLTLVIIVLLVLTACTQTPINHASSNGLSDISIVQTAEDTDNTQETDADGEAEPSDDEIEESGMTNILITVDSTVFAAKLLNNDTVSALLEQFPMTLKMSELNGNEKLFYLPDNLPTDSQQVGSISAGDLMLYGSNCLVLFYKSFPTSYSYTRLGYIEDVSGLTDALGSGSVEVSFTIIE